MRTSAAFRLLGLVAGLAAWSGAAQADCTSPAGVAGRMIYASNIGTMVFCNGTNWVSMAGWDGSSGGASSLAGLSDVNTTGVSAGNALVYNGTQWVPSDTTPLSLALDGLSDVDTSGAAAGSILAYDGGNWVVSSTGVSIPDWYSLTNIPTQVQAVSNSGSMTMASVSASTLNSHYLSSTQGTIGALTGATAAVGGLTVTGDSSQKNISVTNLVQMGMSAQACSTGVSGSLRYNNTSDTLQVCTSGGWVSLVSNTTGLGATTPASSTGAIQFNAGGGTFGGDTDNLYWDNANKRLGIGTGSPGSQLSVSGTGIARLGGESPRLLLEPAAFDEVNRMWSIDNAQNGTLRFYTTDFSATGIGANPIVNMILTSTSALGIGHSYGVFPKAKLDVNGTISASGAIQVGTSSLSCSSTISGSIRYSAVSSTMEYCNSTAWVSMGPSSTQPVAFSAYGSGTQSVASDDSVVVALTNEHFDTNNNFASNRFTVTVPGKYIFTGQTAIDFSGASGEADVWLMLQKNGGVVRSGGRTITHPVNSGGVYPNITAIVDAVPGDYFELVAYQSNGGGGNQYLIGNRTYFSGALLVPQGSGSGGATALSGLSDVNTSGASTGSILAYNGSSWVVSSTVGATPAVSSTGAIQFNAGGGSFGGDTNNLYWDNGNKRLGLGTTAPAATLDVRGLGMVWVSGSTAGYNFVDRSVSDGYTTLYRNANKTRIYDNTGGDRLTIDNITGKVGIGTTNPRAPLDLSGTLYIDGRAGTNAASIEIGMGRTNSDYAYIDLIGDTTYTDYGLRLIRENTGANAVGRLENFGTGGLQLQTNHAAPIAFLTDAGTERMRIAADGKVGIGTAAPQATLQVSGNIIVGGTDGTNWVPLSVVKRASSTGYNDVGQFAVTNNAAGTNYTHLRLYQVETNKMGIEAANQDNTKGALLLNPYSGNVGIGVISPTSTLSVNGNVDIGNGGSGTSYLVKALGSGNSLSLIGDGDNYTQSAIGLRGSTFNWNPAGIEFLAGGAERMRIVSSGLVGIGTATPGMQLHISGDGSARRGILLTQTTANTSWAINNYETGAGEGAGNFGINQVGTGVRLLINTSGNAGFGVNPTDDRLIAQAGTAGNAGVVGYSNNLAAYGFLGYNNAWGVVCTGTSCGGNQAWTNYSDIRLKERIKPLPETDGLATIMKLKPVRFHWKDAALDKKKGEQLGFIAQDVEKLLPELLGSAIDTTITTADGKTTQVRDVKNLSYATLVVPLTKAVQELKAANDNLISETAVLKRANDNLTIEIVGLKAANDTMRVELEALKKAVYGK